MRKDLFKRDLKKFGATLRKLRKKHTKLSLERFAAKVGMDRAYYWGLETGKRNPTLVTVFRLAKSLKLRPIDLFK